MSFTPTMILIAILFIGLVKALMKVKDSSFPHKWDEKLEIKF